MNVNIEGALRLLGQLDIQEWEVRGGLLVPTRKFSQPNLVVLAGRNLVRDLISDKASAGASLTHMAFGTGSTAATAGDTALGTEVFRDAFTQTLTSAGSVVFKYFLGSASANGNTLAEVGLFNASSSGTMFCRTVLSASIVKTSNRAYTFAWTITINAS